MKIKTITAAAAGMLLACAACASEAKEAGLQLTIELKTVKTANYKKTPDGKYIHKSSPAFEKTEGELQVREHKRLVVRLRNAGKTVVLLPAHFRLAGAVKFEGSDAKGNALPPNEYKHMVELAKIRKWIPEGEMGKLKVSKGRYKGAKEMVRVESSKLRKWVPEKELANVSYYFKKRPAFKRPPGSMDATVLKPGEEITEDLRGFPWIVGRVGGLKFPADGDYKLRVVVEVAPGRALVPGLEPWNGKLASNQLEVKWVTPKVAKRRPSPKPPVPTAF